MSIKRSGLKWEALVAGVLIMICFSVQGYAADDISQGRAERGRLISYQHLKTIKKRQVYRHVVNPPFFWAYPTENFDDFHDFYNAKAVRKMIRHHIDVYKIVYETDDGNGGVVISSGAVLIPSRLKKPAPLLSLQRGTIYYDLDAPSHGEMHCWGIWRGLIPAGAGYITMMPDYLGFGASKYKLHPYLMAKPAAVDVVDIIRATITLAEKLNVETNGDLFLAGLSQGGYNTLAAQKEIESHHADELNLVASAPAAGAYSVMDLMTNILGRDVIVAPQAITIILMAYNYFYQWERPMTDFFVSPYAEIIPELHNGTHDGAYITEHLPAGPIELLYAEPFLSDFRGNGEPVLKDTFHENDGVQGWAPVTPTTFYNGTADKVVNFSIAENAYNYFHSQGADVRLVGIDGAGHFESIIPITMDTINWFNSFGE